MSSHGVGLPLPYPESALLYTIVSLCVGGFGSRRRGGRRRCGFLLVVVVATTDRKGERQDWRSYFFFELDCSIGILVETFVLGQKSHISSPRIHGLYRHCTLIAIVPRPPDEIHPCSRGILISCMFWHVSHPPVLCPNPCGQGLAEGSIASGVFPRVQDTHQQLLHAEVDSFYPDFDSPTRWIRRLTWTVEDCMEVWKSQQQGV